MHSINKPASQSHWLFLPHPAVLIYLWICMALLAQSLRDNFLLLMAVAIIFWAASVSATRFISVLRRTRWIFLSITLIYAYATPGSYLWPLLGIFSPTGEGVFEGTVQLFRLLAVLAGLSILLSALSQSQLLGGLYALLRPLSFLGLSCERIAVRLALTLSYAEVAMQQKGRNGSGSMEHLLLPLPVDSGNIELQLISYQVRDLLLVVIATALLWWNWL